MVRAGSPPGVEEVSEDGISCGCSSVNQVWFGPGDLAWEEGSKTPEEEVERVLRQWRSEPLTIVQAAQTAIRWTYEDAARICEEMGREDCALSIRKRMG